MTSSGEGTAPRPPAAGAPPVGDGARGSADDREEALLTRLRALSAHLDDALDPAFVARTRERLVAVAAARSAVPPPARPGGRWSRLAARLRAAGAPDRTPAPRRVRWTAGLAAVSLALGASGAALALSADARPGNPLYGLKRGTEQTRLALAGDDSRGLTLLGFATTRLGELQRLAADPDAGLLVGTLRTMDRQTTEGTYWLATSAVAARDPGALDTLDAWAAAQSAGLRQVSGTAPSQVQPAVSGALDLLRSVAARGEALHTALACAPAPAVAGRDPLGPLPTGCAEPAAPTSAALSGAGPGGPGAPPDGSPASARTTTDGGRPPPPSPVCVGAPTC